MDKIDEVIDRMDLKFTSGNSVEVERSAITKEEWDLIKSYIKDLERNVQLS